MSNGMCGSIIGVYYWCIFLVSIIGVYLFTVIHRIKVILHNPDNKYLNRKSPHVQVKRAPTNL